MSIAAMKQALEALELGQDAFSQTFGGYGYYRPDNPHNFNKLRQISSDNIYSRLAISPIGVLT